MTILDVTMFFIGFDEESIVILKVALVRHITHGLFNVNEPDGAKQPWVVGVQDRLSIMHANTFMF